MKRKAEFNQQIFGFFSVEKGGRALPQVRVRYFGEGVFGTLNRARTLIFFC